MAIKFDDEAPKAETKSRIKFDEPAPKEKSFGEKAFEFVEPTVEALGAVGGGVLGAPLGPVGAVGGAGLGYGITKEGIRLAKEGLGYAPPRTGAALATEPVKDILTGATMEAGGQVLSQALKTGLPSLPKLPTKGRAEKSSVELAEQLKSAQTEAGQAARQRGTRQELALREAESRFGAAASRAKEESKTALNSIAKPTNEFQVGEGLRQVGKTNERQLAATADRAAEVLKTKYFNEGRAKQSAGEFWSQSKTGQEFLKYLQDVMSPLSRGKYTEAEVAAAKDINQQLQSIKVKGQVIRPEIEKIERIIRDVKKLPSKPTMTGADAMKQQYMGKMAQKLEDSVYGYVDEAGAAVEGFAPTGRTFRDVYRKMMQPLNAYESQVGQVLSKELEGIKGIFTSDASQIPAKVFQSPEQVRILEKMDISKKTLEPFATQHAANELSKLNTAEQVRAWISSTKGSYLKEFPQLEAKVNKYAETFAKNEAEVAKREAGAKALGEKRGVVAKTQEAAQKGVAENIAKIEGLQKFSPKEVGKEAIKIVDDLRNQRLISPDQAAKIELDIAAVDRAYQGAEKLQKMRNILLYYGAGSYAGFQGLKLILGQ